MTTTINYLLITKLVVMVILASTIIPWGLIYTMSSLEGRLNKYIRRETARSIIQFISMIAIVLLYLM